MPAKAKKAPTSAAATAVVAEVKSADASLPLSAGPADAGAAPVATPAAEQKEKKPRPPPKIVTGSSVSETRVRKALSNSMSPEISLAVSELKLLKDKEGKVDLPKKFGELNDDTVRLILQHKPEAFVEVEVKDQSDTKKVATLAEQKRQHEMRVALHTLFQSPRSAWAERPLTKEDAKVLRRMVKQDTIRTGDDAINTFTATANFVVRELATAGLKNVRAEEKRVMKLHHVVEDISTLSSWPLLKELKCVASARVDHVKRLQDAAQKLLDKKEKQKKKKAEKVAAATSSAPAVATSEPAAPVVAEAGGEEKVSAVKRVKTPEADFEHHSQNIVREVCQEQNTPCEISGDVKHFCSRVVYELVCMYGELIQSQTTYARVKTIKADTIASITGFILKYTHCQAPLLLKYVDEWLLKLAAEEKKAKEDKAKKAAETAAQAATAPLADVPAVVAPVDAPPSAPAVASS